MREQVIGQKQRNREELLAGQRAEQPGWSDAELEPWADAKQRFSPNVLSVLDQDNGRASIGGPFWHASPARHS